MRRRVVIRPSKIVCAHENLPVAHNHGAEWCITLPGFIERGAHKAFIVGRCVGGGNQKIRRKHSSACQCDNDASPARKIPGAMRTTVIVATSHSSVSRWLGCKSEIITQS
jgi:hypothetical protein